jgi:DNA modification methylase
MISEALHKYIYYQEDGIVLLHGDCLDMLPHFEPNSIDLVLTDPPYGINRINSGHDVIARLGGVIGDDKPFDPTFLLQYGRHQIIWGANHFASKLPDSSAWLMWLKHDHSLFGLRSTSPFELAWTSFDGACKAFRWIWDGSIKQGEGTRKKHVHPTQKPLELMEWQLSLKQSEGLDLVLDPFLGSGTTAVACKQLGRKCIGIELEAKYLDIAIERLRQEVLF